MLQRVLIGLIVALGSTALAGVATADAATGATAELTCGAAELTSPPCGEINPRIMLTFEGFEPGTPMELEAGQSVTFDGTLTFTFNAGDEGYVPEDPNSPISITFSFPRQPFWADMSVEPATFQLSPLNPANMQPGTEDPTAPTLVYEEARPITLTITAIDEPFPTPGYPYAKLQVFAKSTESGIYNPGYGVKEVRITSEDVLALTNAEDGDGSNGVPGPGLLAVVGLSGVAAVAARRLRRE